MKPSHVFDLDKTIWDCFDVHDNSIWAKQLLPPFTVKGTLITDDVGSTCRLRSGVSSYMSSLVSSGAQIGYCSIGRIYQLPDQFQPSLQLLKLFGLTLFTPSLCFLGYKTQSKVDHLVSVGNCVFYDDDPKHHRALQDFNFISIVDSSNLNDWNNFDWKQFV